MKSKVTVCPTRRKARNNKSKRNDPSCRQSKIIIQLVKGNKVSSLIAGIAITYSWSTRVARLDSGLRNTLRRVSFSFHGAWTAWITQGLSAAVANTAVVLPLVSATAVATVATIATVLSAPTTPLPLTMPLRCHRRCGHTSHLPLLHPRCVATNTTADAAYACISTTDFTSNANTDVIPSLLQPQSMTFLKCRCQTTTT